MVRTPGFFIEQLLRPALLVCTTTRRTAINMLGNTITVGNTPAGEYQLSDQIYTPSSGYNANPIFQVRISCADTANPAVADFLLDNFSLTDSTQCP
ncbi:unnamed protein product [Colletotrichum noveboracense]|uniref:Uncharacterized protein n=1 Tax=Colletotrichum noveboracense TaxID=2664923 RepID=A0A9W4S3H2_9PEZI|nr:unnamed protein product [Colletotrichum noveboracense]